MNLHEHQAKEILAAYGVPLPKGKAAFTVEEAVAAAREIGGFPVVVKAQVHAGGRGKAGGVRLVRTEAELKEAAAGLLGSVLRTYQCPSGKTVSRLLIEEATDIAAEFYLAITLDRAMGQPLLMVSAAGGMDVEAAAHSQEGAMHREAIDPALGYLPYQGRKLAAKAGLPAAEFARLAGALYKAYIEIDASLLEINPLAVDAKGRLVALDAKIDIEDNALGRQPDILKLEDVSQLEPLEVEAKRHRLNYLRLEGNIGCMVNGAGLAMTTMDIIKLAGGSPANFLDVGGGASPDQIANAFRILMADSNVRAVFINIFGGILRCERLAYGLIEARRMVEIKVPVVVRLEGTNVEEGRRVLAESGLSFITASDMWDGARKAVSLAAAAVS